MWWIVEVISSFKCSPQHLFSNTLSLHSSLNMSNEILRPYRGRGKIIVLIIFLDTILEDEGFCT
jgi:hypothetical protein